MAKRRAAQSEPAKPSRFFRRPESEIPDIPIEPVAEYRMDFRKIPLPPEPEPGYYESLQKDFELSAARILLEQKDYGTHLQIFGEMEKGNPILRVEISQNGVTRFKLISADNAVLLCENLGIFLADYVRR